MKNILAIFALAFPLVGQCFNTLPPGVTSAPAFFQNPFNNINGGAAPWCSPLAPISAITGGQLKYGISSVPDYPNGPVIFDLVIGIGTTLATTSYPVGFNGGVGNVIPTLFVYQGIIVLGTGPVYTGCYPVTVLTVPPVPGAIGLPVYSQAFIRDPFQNTFAGSNITCFNL